MANTAPVILQISVDGGAKATVELNNVAKSTERVGSVASAISGKLKNVFAAGAIAAFAKQSLGFAAGLKDVSDQFSISASEAMGFITQIQNVGGSSEKAVGILQRLQKIQEETNDPRSLSEFINSIRQSYEETGNFGQIIELVGTKNAPVFAAALREMSGGLEQFKNDATDATAATADAITESFDAILKRVYLFGAEFVVANKEAWGGAASFWATLFSGGGLDAALNNFDKNMAQTSDAAKRAAENIKSVNEAMAESRRAAMGAAVFSDELKRLESEQKLAEDWWKEKEREARNLYTIPDRLMGGRDKEDRADPFRYDLTETMGSQSSAAVVNFQKYQAAQQTSESKQLTVMSNIERYVKQTAENTRGTDQIQVIDEGDFQ